MSESTSPVLGSMTYAEERRVRMHYTYANRQPGPVELWLSLPPELPMQRRVQIHRLTPEPLQVQADGLGLNQLAFLRLARGETLHLDVSASVYRATYDAKARGPAPTLEDAERALYLRSSSLIQVNDDVLRMAQHIIGDAALPLVQTRRLYTYLIRHGRYRWPPAARGSEAMRRGQPMKGDCGDYSFLYAAWCRALGLPCRVLIGSWAHGRCQAHAWNEVFLDGIGWLPVDASAHAQGVYLPGLSELDWAMRRVHHRFGRLAGDRLAFSLDPDIPLRPPYVDEIAPEWAPRSRFGNRTLAWGFERLDGAAPYLQPVYPRFSEAKRPLETEAQLGSWRFEDPLGYRALTALLWAGVAFGVLGALRLVVLDRVPISLGWIVADLILLQRNGPRWWLMGPLVVLMMDAIVRLAEG